MAAGPIVITVPVVWRWPHDQVIKERGVGSFGASASLSISGLPNVQMSDWIINMLHVIMLSVVMLSVMVPHFSLSEVKKLKYFLLFYKCLGNCFEQFKIM